MECSICGEFDPAVIPEGRGIKQDETERLIGDLGRGTKCVHWRYQGEVLTLLGVANPFPKWAMSSDWIVCVALELGVVTVTPSETPIEPPKPQVPEVTAHDYDKEDDKGTENANSDN